MYNDKTTIEKIIDKEAHIKHKIITRKYPEVNKIFGIENKAYDLYECIYDYSYIQYLNLIAHNNILLKIYDYYVEEIANLIYDLRNDANMEEIMNIYCYLLFNGYLSKNKSFKFLFPEKELNLKMGLSVIYGQGVCRNVGDLFSDILNMYNIKNYPIITDRSSCEKSIATWDKYAHLINNKMSGFIEQADEYYSDHQPITGDHYEVLVKDIKWKVFDPSNCAYYNIYNKDNGHNALNYLKLWSLYAQGKCNIKDTINFYNFLKNKYLYLYDCKDKLLLQKDCYESCEKDKRKILKFHKKNYCYIDKISTFMECIQKK